jgi:preprotein translocase subunit YajC
MSLSTALILAVAAPAADPNSGLLNTVANFAPLLFIGLMGYFLMWRPQQQRQKQQAAMINGVKRGDTVVMSSGIIGKVVRVEDKELGVEIAQNVSIKVIKSMIIEVRVKGEPAAANDSKA